MTTNAELNRDFASLERTAMKVKRDRDALLAAAKAALNYTGMDYFLDDAGSHKNLTWAIRKEHLLALRQATKDAEGR